MIELSPSLLSADFYNLEKDLKELEDSGIKYLHLDIMDGNFVPNISYGPGLIKALRPNSNLIFDTHLMIENPEKYIDDFADAGCDIITVHPESTRHLHRVIQKIKNRGLKAGVVLNPHTHESVLKYVIHDIDLILIMSVNPGFGGQEFIPSQLEKIRSIRKLIDQSGKDILLEVDGGIKANNVQQVFDAGANLIVSGSGIFNKDGIKHNIEEFNKIIKN